jgi:hypothetical protein
MSVMKSQPLGGNAVMPVAVFVPDAAVGPMNDELRLLVACDLARCVDRLLLGVVHGGRALVAFALDSPSVLVGYYVLILAGHESVLLLKLRRQSSPAG